MPQDAEEQVTVHVTPLFARSLPTVAVNGPFVPAIIVALDGCMLTVIAATVTVDAAAASVLATEVAVTVIVESPGGGPGAV